MRYGLWLGLVLPACASQPLHMRPAAGPETACSADAYVVFVRPERSGSMVVELREADGTFLGRLEDTSYFGVSVAPGEHFFVARLVGYEDSRPIGLKAELDAGLTYFVDVELWRDFPILYAVAPRHGYWGELGGWLARSHRLEPDPAAGPPPPPADWADYYYNYVFAWWASLDEQGVAERKLIPSDGSLEPTPYAKLDDSCGERPVKPRAMVAAASRVSPQKDVDVPRCWTEIPTGTHMRVTICKTERQLREEREDAWQFMNKPRAHPGFW